MKKFLVLVFSIFLIMAFSTCLFSKVQVGELVMEKFASPHPYKGVKGLVLEQVFHWSDAGYIAIHFSNFDLAPGDYVEISSPDGRYYYEYKEKGKVVRGGQAVLSNFWATHIPGDTAIVRLYSKNRGGGWGFVIDKSDRSHVVL